MTYQEKRALLRQDSTGQKLWYANLVIIALSFALGLFLTIQAIGITTGEASQAFVVTTFTLGLLLVVLYFWGAFRLTRWIWIVMWVGLGLSVLTFNIVNIIFHAFFLWSYRRVLKAVTEATQLTKPPIPPAA